MQEVQLKSLDDYPDLPEAAKRPATTTGIWHSLYDHDAKITEMWFLRELSFDEYYRKVCGSVYCGSHQPSIMVELRLHSVDHSKAFLMLLWRLHCAQPSSIHISCSAGLWTCYVVQVL